MSTLAPTTFSPLPEAMVAESSDDTGAGRASEIVVCFSWTILGNPHSMVVQGQSWRMSRVILTTRMDSYDNYP